MRLVSIILTLLAASSSSSLLKAADELPLIRSTRAVVSIREGETLHPDAWRLSPDAKPDVYTVELKEGKAQKVSFITDVESITFDVEEGKSYDFVIQHGDDRCWTRIIGQRAIPAAVFDATYRRRHAGRISVEVPEVYELVNVVIALTPTAIADGNLVYRKSAYWEAVRDAFEPFREHDAVKMIDAELQRNRNLYSSLKMNGYAFEFDRDGRIVQSRVYDRTAFPSEKTNSLRPFLPQLQAFADASGFRKFYRRHRRTYAEQASFYRSEAEVRSMDAWLRRNFPGGKGYDSIKIIFSPLVAYSQSATWMESNGFRELQAHVNYPYPADVQRMVGDATLSREGEGLVRTVIVFTELNHGFINPEADRYAERIVAATSNRDAWVDPSRGPGYYGGISLFNEYLNWGLISLLAADTLTPEEQRKISAAVDAMMTRRRGFLRFDAFDAFLVDLYRNRGAGKTIADLYPEIIAWFERH